jgi:hypothetical protein
LNQPKDILSKRHQLLAASALVPIIGALSRPTTLQALIYTLFVCIYLTPFVIRATKKPTEGDGSADVDAPAVDGSSLAESATAQIKHLKQSQRASTINFVLVLIGSGLISELLAWVSELFAPTVNPAMIHPQLLADLFLGFFFYLGLALAWLWLLKSFQFTFKEIFFLCFLVALLKQAKLGTLTGICERLVSDPVSALLTLASLLVVGGSVSSLAFLTSGKACPQGKKPDMSKLLTKYTVSLILIALLPELACLGGSLIARPLGLCPDKKPIWEAPLI